MADKAIGEVSNFFEKVMVAAIKLSGKLEVGDKIRIKGGELVDFTQEVTSMQINHENVGSAEKGDEIGIKVEQRIRKGYKVYKVYKVVGL